MLSKIEINPVSSVTATVIWLHGLGASGHDFEPIVAELSLPQDSGIRFIFPHAPVQPVTLNGGIPMPAWFDIYGLDRYARQDEKGIQASEQAIIELIEAENQRGISSERIILAGFSQGGALALYLGLRYQLSLAGIMGLSTYLPLEQQLKAQLNLANQSTPVFLAHGFYDTILPYSIGRITYEMLAANNYSVEWHDYLMEHQISADEIGDISAWLLRVLCD